MTITEFLEARIAEDEAAARAAIDPERPGTHWQWVTNETDVVIAPGDEVEAISFQDISLRSIEEFPTESVGELPAFIIHRVEEMQEGAGSHIARHDPARVLAECAAKRAIINLHRATRFTIPDPNKVWPEVHTFCSDGHVEIRVAGKEVGRVSLAEYRERVDVELVIAPELKALAAVYKDHPDYLQEWAL